MWVWKKLGYNHVGELPERSLEDLGRRCRVVGDDFLEGEESAWYRRLLLDHAGQALEVSEAPGPINLRSTSSPSGSRPPSGGRSMGGASNEEMSWRLATIFRDTLDIRICVPGNVDLQQAPAPLIADAFDRSSTYKSMEDALKDKIEYGGGTIYFEAPVVGIKLCEDIAAECSESIGPDEWPMYALGADLGAVLYIVVEVQATHSFKSGEMGIACDVNGLVQEVIVDGPAHTKGIQQGYQIVKVGNAPYSKDALARAEKSGRDYQVTFEVGNSTAPSTSEQWSSTSRQVRTVGNSTAHSTSEQGGLSSRLTSIMAMSEGIEEHPPQMVQGDGFRLRIFQAGGPLVDPGKINSGQATHYFEKGQMMGISYADNGVVTEVFNNGPARSKGIRVGSRIVQVGDAQYSKNALITAENSGKQYKITFQARSETGSPTLSHIATEFERWAGKPLGTQPATWRTLHVRTEAAGTESGIPSSIAFKLPGEGRRLSKCLLTGSIAGNAGGLDVVLAATATVEIVKEPFELTYGEAHCKNLKHMFEAEVAEVLKIAPEQVMCGEFAVVGQKQHSGPGKKHVRKNTVLLTFAILHNEMVEVRTRLQSLRDPSKAFSAKLMAKNLLSDMASSGNGSIAMNVNSAKPSGQKKLLPQKSLIQTNSLPDLQVSPPRPDLHGLTMDLSRNAHAGLQPDLLLRKFMAALNDRKHPIRRHGEVFPMVNLVIKGGLSTGVALLANTSVVTPGRICESLNEFMKGQKPPAKSAVQLDLKMHADMAEKRKGIISDDPNVGYDETKTKSYFFRTMSPKELLDQMESSLALPNDLAACLDVLLEWTRTDQDAQGNADQCIKLKYHSILERMTVVMRQFKSERVTMYNVITIHNSLTRHDVGCVDRILDKHLAPGIMTVLENFPADHEMQVEGVAMLKRIYQRARETSLHGPRSLTLGKGLDPVWTVRGVDRILDAMEKFEDDQDLQFDACNMLVALAETLLVSGRAEQTFERVRLALVRYPHRADLAVQGTQIFGRMGPRFLQMEHRGVRMIVDTMERHRSNVEVQRCGARAFFDLAKTEEALKISRNGGGIGAMLIAMFAHSTDSQVLQESTRALEKHCPVALSRIFAVCGDLKETLPPVYWRSDPLDLSGKTNFCASDMTDVMKFENVQTIDHFLAFMMEPAAYKSESPAKGAAPARVESSLDTVEGYRRVGLRDELDALDDLCALPGPASTGLSSREAGQANPQLKKDLEKLRALGCDGSHLLVRGPQEIHLKRMVEELQKGAIAPTMWGANDGEMMVLLLGLYAWHSPSKAMKMVSFGAAKALVTWLRAEHLESGRSIADEADRYPLQRACIGAIASIARHGGVCVEELLKVDAAPLVLSFTNHLNISIKRNAVRCVARMLPHAPRGEQGFDEKEIWKLVLNDLADKDDTVRTCAAACAMEIIYGGWTAELTEVDAAHQPDMDKFVASLLNVLQYYTPLVGEAPSNLQSSGALPVLLAMTRLVDEDTLQFIGSPRSEPRKKVNEQLLRLLRRWLPAASPEAATSLDRAAATGAAKALEALSKKEVPLKSRDMEGLLKYGSVDTAPPALWEACYEALKLAIEREANVEVLGQLFSTRVPRTGGAEGLARLQVLDDILQRILDLLRRDPTSMSDRLLESLESATRLMPKGEGEEFASLDHSFNEVKNFGLSPQERQEKEKNRENRVPTEDNQATMLPSGKV